MPECEGEEECPTDTEHVRSGKDQTYGQPAVIDEPGVEDDDERHIHQHYSNTVQNTLEDENRSNSAEESCCDQSENTDRPARPYTMACSEYGSTFAYICHKRSG